MAVPTAEEDALTAALLWLADEPRDSRLMEARFGRRADGSGCWWHLRFQRDVSSGELEDPRQDDQARFSMVVQAWNKELVESAAS